MRFQAVRKCHELKVRSNKVKETAMAAKRHHTSHKKHDDKHHKDPRPHMQGHHDDRDGQYKHHAISDGQYAGFEDRRRQEMRDAGMIHEDHSAIANLPQHVMIKPYGMERDYLPEVLDDTIRGIEEQKSADNAQRQKHFKPHKY